MYRYEDIGKRVQRQWDMEVERRVSQIAFQIGPASFLCWPPSLQHRFDIANIVPTLKRYGLLSGMEQGAVRLTMILVLYIGRSRFTRLPFFRWYIGSALYSVYMLRQLSRLHGVDSKQPYHLIITFASASWSYKPSLKFSHPATF